MKPISIIVLLAAIVSLASARSLLGSDAPLTVTMTNDPGANTVLVYSAAGALLQSIPTGYGGGVGGNGFGVRAAAASYSPESYSDLVAVVNYNGGYVSVFKRTHNGLSLIQCLKSSSKPVSVDFGGDHLYVAGDYTVDSFSLKNWALDGTATLDFGVGGFDVTGPLPASTTGVTAQVGYVAGGTLPPQLLITLKNATGPGAVDVISLNKKGAVTGLLVAVAGPPGSQTPFGFSTLPDGTAIITLAHSNQIGLFKNNAFVFPLLQLDQAAPCWTTYFGKYIYTGNTMAQTISRLVSTGFSVFVDGPGVAPNDYAATTAASVTDMAVGGGYLAALLPGNAASATKPLTLSAIQWWSLDVYGALTLVGSPVTLSVGGANGIAIV